MDTRKFSIKMIMQVHDELIFEVDENFKDSCCKSIKEIMEKAVTLDVPLVVDINHGNNWTKLTNLSSSK